MKKEEIRMLIIELEKILEDEEFDEDTQFLDIDDLLNDYIDNDFELLMSHVIDEWEIIIGYRQIDNQFTYSVLTVIDDEVTEKQYYSALEDAYHDFINRFYSISVDYYKQLERQFNDMIDSFTECFLEEYEDA